MTASRSLTLDQHRAATLLGRGWQAKDAAREVGVHPVTVSRWNQRPEFRALVTQAREAHLAEMPTARATLEAALTATSRSGVPDWQVRVAAARALLARSGAADTSVERTRETVIYEERLEESERGADAG